MADKEYQYVDIYCRNLDKYGNGGKCTLVFTDFDGKNRKVVKAIRLHTIEGKAPSE